MIEKLLKQLGFVKRTPEERAERIYNVLGADRLRLELARLNWEIIKYGHDNISEEQAAHNIAQLLGTEDIRTSDKKLNELFLKSMSETLKRKEG